MTSDALTLGIAAACKGEARLRATAVLAYVTLDDLAPAPIPEDLRRAMASFTAGGAAGEVA